MVGADDPSSRLLFPPFPLFVPQQRESMREMSTNIKGGTYLPINLELVSMVNESSSSWSSEST